MPSIRPIQIYLGLQEFAFVKFNKDFKTSYYNTILEYAGIFLMSYNAVVKKLKCQE